MKEQDKVTIQGVKGSGKEYIIKNHNGINIGHFTVFDYDVQNKRASIRISYYNREAGLLEASLRQIIFTIFKDKTINKINIYSGEETDIAAFTACGLELQGILEDNIYNKGSYENELIFGIDIAKYNSFGIKNNLSMKDEEGNYEDIIYLKFLTPENAQELLEYYTKNKEHLSAFEPKRDRSFYTLETQRQLLSEDYWSYLNGIKAGFGIFLNNELIGKIKLSNIVYGSFKSGIIGYSIASDKQGRGYATRALKLLCDYAFNEMELHRLEASTLIDNYKSQGVLKNCGFKELGRNEKYLCINGKWQDHITFYKINE